MICTYCKKDIEGKPLKSEKHGLFCNNSCFSTYLWSTPEYRKKASEKTFDNPEWKRKYQSRENLQYRIEGWKKKYASDSEYRDRRNAGVAKANSERVWTQEGLNKLSRFASDLNKDLNNLFGTPLGKWTQYSGTNFRSSWEAKLAKSLDEVGIIWEYEKERVILSSGRSYLPDFYLPILDIYIEVKAKHFLTFDAIQKVSELHSQHRSAFICTEDTWDDVLLSCKMFQEELSRESLTNSSEHI